MQIKTTMWYHLTPVRMTIIKITRNNKGWQRCGEKGTFVNCWWECKLVLLWKTAFRILKIWGVCSFRLGCAVSLQCKALSTLIVSKPACMHSLQVESRILQPLYLSQSFYLSQELVVSAQDPRTEMPRLWLNLLTPQGKCSLYGISPPTDPSWGADPDPMPFFLVLPGYMETFLWLHRNSSTSF